jgi:hypothetical protein
MLLAGPPIVTAATNSAMGGIGGINNGTLSGGDGTGTAQITLNSAQLALVKQARDLSGNVLANGTNVVAGQAIYFVLYIDNTTSFQAQNLTIQDLLTLVEFSYTPGSLETTTVPSGSSNAAIWAGTWTPLTDGVDGDAASHLNISPAQDRITVGDTAGLSPSQANQSFNIPAGQLTAIRFRVVVQ